MTITAISSPSSKSHIFTRIDRGAIVC
ncbi:MAG: hypothetical protein ACUVTP_06315 [Candidatus Fervidibacter sp.]